MMNEQNQQNAERDLLLGRHQNRPIFFFDLDPILARSGSHLARHPEQLMAICRHELEEISRDETLIFGINVFYLIVNSIVDDAALALASRLNSALLHLFFGDEASIPEGMRCLFHKVDALPAPKATTPSATQASLGDEDDKKKQSDSRDMFVELAMRGTLSGQNVELTFVPVADLKRGRTTTFFCTPAFCVEGAPVIYGYKAFNGLDSRDLPLVDRAILAHALKFARRLAQNSVYTAIGAPVSFDTLATIRGRAIYQDALTAAGVADYPFMNIVIRDIPSGVTASRLADIVGCIQPLAKRVFVHLPDTDVPVIQSGRLGATGFILSLPSRPTPIAVERATQWLSRVCEAEAALSCIDRIDNDTSLEIVKHSPVRFGAGSEFGPTEFRGNALPMEVESFMRAAARAAQAETHRHVHRFGKRDRGHLHQVN